MSSNTPDDRERPVTRQEFRTAQLLVAGALVFIALALFCLLALNFVS